MQTLVEHRHKVTLSKTGNGARYVNGCARANLYTDARIKIKHLWWWCWGWEVTWGQTTLMGGRLLHTQNRPKHSNISRLYCTKVIWIDNFWNHISEKKFLPSTFHCHYLLCAVVGEVCTCKKSLFMNIVGLGLWFRLDRWINGDTIYFLLAKMCLLTQHMWKIIFYNKCLYTTLIHIV